VEVVDFLYGGDDENENALVLIIVTAISCVD